MELIQPSIDLLAKMNYFLKNNPHDLHLEPNLQKELSLIALEIEKMKFFEKEQKKQMRAYPDYLKESVALIKKQPAVQEQVRSDYFNHLVKEVFSIVCFQECFCHYFDLKELLKLRLVCSNFNVSIQNHFQGRIPHEEGLVAKMIFSQVLADLSQLKLFLFNQIPAHVREWIEWDPNICKEKITRLLSKQDYETLKQMRSIPKQFDLVFAPMALLFSNKEKQHHSYFSLFKETFTTFTFGKIEQTLRKNLLRECSVIKCAEKLSELRSSEQEVLRFSRVCHSMIGWCQYVVSLYFLENIFAIRDDDLISYKGTLLDFGHLATVTQFFRNQYYLINACKNIAKIEQRFIIYLDFSNLNFIKTEPQERTDLFISENKVALLNICNFLTFKEIIQLRLVSKFFKDVTESYFLETLTNLIYQFELIKLNTTIIQTKFPMLYDFGFFSPLVDLCFTILNEQQRNLIQHNSFELLKATGKNNPNNHFIQQFCSAFCYLFSPSNISNPIQYVKSLIAQTKLIKVVKENSNPFAKSIDQILYAEYNLELICKLISQNPKQNYNIQGMQSLFSYMKLFIMIFKSLNPLLFVRQAHVNIFLFSQFKFEKKFTEEEQGMLVQLNEVFVMCLTFLKTLYQFGKLTSQTFKACLTTALERFTLSEKQSIANQLNQRFFQVYQEFNQQQVSFEKTLVYLTEIIKIYDESNLIYETKVSTKITVSQKQPLDFMSFSKIFIINVLPYLSVQQLLSFSLVNRTANNIYKMHLISRIYIEGNDLKQLELQNKTKIHGIMKKRGTFNISKDNAFNLMSELSNKDIANLRSVTHPNQWYDLFAQPFTVLFELNVSKNNYWQALLKNIISQQDAYKRFSEFETETMNQSKVLVIQSLLNDSRYSITQAERMNLSLFKLIKWLQGVIQMHQLLRRYCLTMNDTNLDEEESQYFQLIDKRQLMAYKAVRFINRFQQGDQQFNEFSKWFQIQDQ